MIVLAIDPGDTESAYSFWNEKYELVDTEILKNRVKNPLIAEIIKNSDKVTNDVMKDICKEAKNIKVDFLAIEMIASYGMAVGKNVFETCVYIGRFIETISSLNIPYTYIYRKWEKIAICNSMKANDSNIRQALIDRFGEVGTKKNPGFFYGFKKDIWAAAAVAVTFLDVFYHDTEHKLFDNINLSKEDMQIYQFI